MKKFFMIVGLFFSSCTTNMGLKSESGPEELQKANAFFSKRNGRVVFRDGSSDMFYIERITKDTVYARNRVLLAGEVQEVVITRKGGGLFLGMLAGATPGILGTLAGTNSEGINPSSILIVIGGVAGAGVGLLIDFKDHLRFEQEP